MKTIFHHLKESSDERLRHFEMAHAERIRAIELSQPLPEVEIARAKMHETRARAAAGILIVRTVFMAVGPAAICGVAVGATNVILVQTSAALHPILVTIVWAAATLISIAVVVGMMALGQPSIASDWLQGQMLEDFSASPAEFTNGKGLKRS